MWKCYELVFKAKSPIYIGYGVKLGIVNRTRYYITGKLMWGALTAILSRKIMNKYDPEIYEKIGNFVKEHLIFSHFYIKKDNVILFPNYTENGLGFGSDDNEKFIMSKEEFEKSFISSYISTAMDKSVRTAEEDSLHEFELVNNSVEGKNVEFVGYLFTNLEKNNGYNKYDRPIFVKEVNEKEITVKINGKNIEIFNLIKNIQVGGERIYGFGKLKLINIGVKQEGKIFDRYHVDLNSNKPRIKAKDEVIALSHVLLVSDKRENYFERIKSVKGDLEPLVWREWSKKGVGQDPKFGGIALVPGSKFQLDEKRKVQITDYGIWKPI